MSRTVTILLAVCLLLAAASATWFLQRDSGPNVRSGDLRSPSSPARPPGNNKPADSPWSRLTTDSLPTHQRLEIARQISGSLSKGDTAALFAAMDHTPRSGGEEDWYVILNEIMEQMRRHGLGSDEYAAKLGEIITDSGRTEVVRDYAIQHLALWIAPGNPDQVPHEKNPALVGQSLSHIATAIRDTAVSNTSIPGTALLALADISPNLPAETITATWSSLEPYLQGIISGETSTQLSTRVSAIQAVSLTAQQPYLPAIRSLAASETADPSIRLSSIASLGFYASPEDQALLETLATGDTRYKYAAQSALGRLTN